MTSCGGQAGVDRDVPGTEHGVGTMLAVGMMVVIMMIGYAALVVAGYFAAVHRARTAADLAALSGAVAVTAGLDGCAQAERIAVKNAARAVACDRVGDQLDFVVTVRASVDVGTTMRGLPRTVEAVGHAGPGAS